MAEQEGAKRESIEKETATGQPNVVVEDDSNRAEFSNHCEYFLSSLGLAVGLGNIWRFPYKCYENGGGTFLFPYLLCLFLCGLPLLFMEMALGQYAGLSSTKIFAQISPGLKGMGYGMVSINKACHDKSKQDSAHNIVFDNFRSSFLPSSISIILLLWLMPFTFFSLVSQQMKSSLGDFVTTSTILKIVTAYCKPRHAASMKPFLIKGA